MAAPNAPQVTAVAALAEASTPKENMPPASAGKEATSSLGPTPSTENSLVSSTVALQGSIALPSAGIAPGITEAMIEADKLNNTAVRLANESNYEDARALFERAIEAEPNMARYHRNLSVVFERMKKIDDALASARTAAKLAPSDPSVLEQLCGLELAKENTATALGCFEKLRSIEPLDALSETHYGIALFRSGKEAESLTILEKAVRSPHPLAEALNALGVVYYTKRRVEDAVAAFKSGVEISPDKYEIRYNLAIAQLSLRNRAAAISQYNILKTGDPKLADRLYRIISRNTVLVAREK
jgi:tetratricopeptide (TPR) repeat protein